MDVWTSILMRGQNEVLAKWYMMNQNLPDYIAYAKAEMSLRFQIETLGKNLSNITFPGTQKTIPGIIRSVA